MDIPAPGDYNISIGELMNQGYTFIPNPDPERPDGFYDWGDGAHLFRQNAMTTYATQRRPDGLWELYGKPEEYQEYQGYQDYKGYNNNRYETEQVGGKRKYKTKSSKLSNRKTKKNKRSRKNKTSRKYKRS